MKPNDDIHSITTRLSAQNVMDRALLKTLRKRGYFKIAIVDEVELSLLQAGFRKPIREYHFARETITGKKNIRKQLAINNLRDWRFDLAIVDIKIAFELDGGTRMVRRGPKGVMVGGRHNNADDIMKINHAQRIGWKVFRFTNEMVKNGTANQFIWNLAADQKSKTFGNSI